MTYLFRDIRVWSWGILLNICWVSIPFYILIVNISLTVDQIPIKHIFWKSVMRTFRYIYINCFNKLSFLLGSVQNYKKCTFLDNLRTITEERNMKTRQMTPFFSSTFSAQFITFIFVFRNSQNSFPCGPPFGPFWSVKYLNFGVAHTARFLSMFGHFIKLCMKGLRMRRLRNIFILSTGKLVIFERKTIHRNKIKIQGLRN